MKQNCRGGKINTWASLTVTMMFMLLMVGRDADAADGPLENRNNTNIRTETANLVMINNYE